MSLKFPQIKACLEAFQNIYFKKKTNFWKQIWKIIILIFITEVRYIVDAYACPVLH